LTDTDIDKAKKLYNVNVFGLVEVTKIFVPMLVAAKGRIVNIGSVASKVPMVFQGMYNGSKAAVQAISDTLRLELAPFGVGVIHVVTGGVRTLIVQNATSDYDFPIDSLYGPARSELDAAIRGSTTDSFLTSELCPAPAPPCESSRRETV